MKALGPSVAPPEDEMLLAEMIAATSERGMSSCSDEYFEYDIESGERLACCALGALVVAKRATFVTGSGAGHRVDMVPSGIDTDDVCHGNDVEDIWSSDDQDDGESLGWAFREAMRPETETQ